MNAATETVAADTRTTTAAMVEIAERIAAEKAVITRARANGNPKSEMMDWTHQCRVYAADGVVYVSAPQNRVLDKAASQELLRSTQKAITLAWDAAGLLPGGKVRAVKREGAFVWRTGDWYMGSFWTNGRCCGFRVPGTY